MFIRILLSSTIAYTAKTQPHTEHVPQIRHTGYEGSGWVGYGVIPNCFNILFVEILADS